MQQYTIDDFREGKVIVKIDPDNNSDVLKLRKLMSLVCPWKSPENLPKGINIYYRVGKFFTHEPLMWLSYNTPPIDAILIVSINEINMENTIFKFGDLLDVTFYDATSVGEFTYVAPIPGDLHLITTTSTRKISTISGRSGPGTVVRTVPITALRHSIKVKMSKKEIEEKLSLPPGSLVILV